MSDAAISRGPRSVRSLMLGATVLSIVLALYAASIVVRREPDDFGGVLSAFVALVGFVGLMCPVLMFRRARHFSAAFGSGSALLLGVASVCVAEQWSDDLHWRRSIGAFSDMVTRGSLMCEAETCAAGNWTATRVIQQERLVAVFVEDEFCYAGFGFLLPSDGDVSEGVADEALTALGLGYVDVYPWRDGWMSFCITT